jgi:membrane protease YdiL (CAAX protease family)
MLAGSVVIAAGTEGWRRADHSFAVLVGFSLLLLAGSLLLLRQPWKRETVFKQAVCFFTLFYTGLILGMVAQRKVGAISPSPFQMFVATLSIQGAALIFSGVFARQHQVSLAQGFGFNQEPWRALGIGFLLACFVLPLGVGLQWVSVHLMERFPWRGLKPEEQEAVQALKVAVGWGERLSLGIVTILVAPIAEEILFRGILYPYIKFAGFPKIALWGTSILFALIHFNIAIFIPLVVLALCLTVIYEKTGNLLAPITTHAIFNSVNFVLLYTTQMGNP